LFLGLSENDLRNLPQFKASQFKKESYTLGCLYVLEGSKLGGQMISRHAKEKLNFTNVDGTRFFSAHGAKTGSYWKEFIDTLNLHAVDTKQEDAIIEGAKDTFADFGKWLKTSN
jgi:heme oxygenase